MTERTKGILILFAVYLVACAAGYLASPLGGNLSLPRSAVAVVVAVGVIFLFSVLFNNSSVFDPYWSVAPPLMVLFYIFSLVNSLFNWQDSLIFVWEFLKCSPRISMLLLFTLIYGARLTWNFLRGWPGMKHEDWRYVGFRNSTGKAYWLVSLGGIHLFPALMVFGGTLSIWVTVIQGVRQVNYIDVLAMLVTGYGILLEAVADLQLRRHSRACTDPGKTMDQGLWAFSRHPNYLGEITFWWGLYLFALAANPAYWWVIIGPAAITLMFLFASIPMIEKRMAERRHDYGEYKKRVGMLLPRFKR